jgi:hypothetical protein
MARKVSRDEAQKSSTLAAKRWDELWHTNATENKKTFELLGGRPEIVDFGAGKDVVVFAFGPSFTENMTALIGSRAHYTAEVAVVDKALKSAVEVGCVPDFCMVADGQVDFERWGNVPESVCKKTVLLSSVTANWRWARHWQENGGKVAFFLNRDSILTHREYGKFLSHERGEAYIIPAGSNVANSLYVASVMVIGYKSVYLCAFDYSFRLDGDYYGTKEKIKETNFKVDKHAFNNHGLTTGVDGGLVQTSQSMDFSARWLCDFSGVMTKQLGVTTINLTGRGVLRIPLQAKIKGAA